MLYQYHFLDKNIHNQILIQNYVVMGYLDKELLNTNNLKHYLADVKLIWNQIYELHLKIMFCFLLIVTMQNLHEE